MRPAAANPRNSMRQVQESVTGDCTAMSKTYPSLYEPGKPNKPDDPRLWFALQQVPEPREGCEG